MTNVKTYQNLLSDARTIVQDVNTDPTLQRYPDQTLVDILNRGLQELYRLRPDAYYDQWDDTALDFDVPVIGIYNVDTPPYTAWTDAFELPMMYYNPLVSWVIGMLESVDDEFTEDSRSTAFLAQFKQMVVGL